MHNGLSILVKPVQRQKQKIHDMVQNRVKSFVAKDKNGALKISTTCLPLDSKNKQVNISQKDQEHLFQSHADKTAIEWIMTQYDHQIDLTPLFQIVPSK